MKLPIFQVDAFTKRRFAGNPAAVVPLEAPLPDDILQAIGAENNLSETAFLVPRGSAYDLRWFTPTVEVDLCGHATLAAAFILFQEGRVEGDEVEFETRSGPLTVWREGTLLCMDFPSRPPRPISTPGALIDALGTRPIEVHQARDLLVVLESETAVKALAPDVNRMTQLDAYAIIVTARGDEVDFVSRFFAPRQGIFEDPVTGSAHCTLAPFWADRLGRARLRARQVSARGGELECEVRGERIILRGEAVLYLRGEIEVLSPGL